MKKFFVWAAIMFVVAVAGAWVVLQYVIKQKPFATAADYWEQPRRHRLTSDAVGQWNYMIATIDLISHAQEKFLPVTDPYDKEMFRKWVEENQDNPFALERIYYQFSHDGDYGWPPEMQGVGWMWTICPYIWSSPSVAIIEPGRSAEAAFVVKEALDMLRSPAGWRDYVITQGYGDPMRQNVMWKGPVLIAEGVYALMTGDQETFGPEMETLARDLYETQQRHLSLPLGQGFSGGVECEPNHWFPQCNSMGVIGLALYDKIYGVDRKHNVKLGEKYQENYMKFLREHMTDPRSGLIYRVWHPYGPQQADKDLSGFSNVMVALDLKTFEPEFSQNLYDHLRLRYIRRFPLGLGTYVLEVPEYDLQQQLVNPGADSPGMLGETSLNIFLALVATREFNDQETFDGINTLLTNFTHPFFRQGQVRFDETNDEPSGIEGFTTGNLMNMFSAWWFFAKVHVGWKAILEYDWSQNRDAAGRMRNEPEEMALTSSAGCCSGK